MNWQPLVHALFENAHTIERTGDVISGTAQLNSQTLTVVGTTDHAAIGVETALAQAKVILDTVQNHPGRAILLLVGLANIIISSARQSEAVAEPDLPPATAEDLASALIASGCTLQVEQLATAMNAIHRRWCRAQAMTRP